MEKRYRGWIIVSEAMFTRDVIVRKGVITRVFYLDYSSTLTRLQPHPLEYVELAELTTWFLPDGNAIFGMFGYKFEATLKIWRSVADADG